jgi:LacI family transcriptional regulator
VSADRRERVLAAMKQLGYQPNAIARSLSSTETLTLGMIVPNVSNGFFAELALAVEEAALRRGRLLFVGNSNESSEREEAYITNFVRQRVDGIVIVGVTRESSVRRVLEAAVPLVVLDRELAGSGARTISIDHRAAAFEATAHLLSHGYRTVSCLTGPADQAVAKERLKGWAEALRVGGVDPAEQSVVRESFSLDGGMRGFEELFRRPGGLPAALFASTDDQARGAISAAGLRGVAVPGGFAVASVDGTRDGAYSNPPLTSVEQPFAELAETAITALLGDDVDGVEDSGEKPRPGAGDAHIMVGTRLRIRRSCGCG